MDSYLAASARERLARVFDPDSFDELPGPGWRMTSPHLAQLGLPAAADDGVAVGRASLAGRPVYAAAQDGSFLGGAVGEVHGAKLVGLLRRAATERAGAVLLLLDSGGVRLHEANAGLIAVSEVMRAVLAARAAGVAVVALIGGPTGVYGGMGIVAGCCNAIVMSAQGRLALSGPEVIATACGTAEFDARDRALVWRTSGGKQRYLLGDAQLIVADSMAAFRQGALTALDACAAAPAALTLAALEQEQAMLGQRIARFGACRDPLDIWATLGLAQPGQIPDLAIDAFIAAAAAATGRQETP